MKGMLNMSFFSVGISEDESVIGGVTFNEDDIEEFKKGDVVEILKVIESSEYLGDKAFVIFNPKNLYSCTVSSVFVDQIKN